MAREVTVGSDGLATGVSYIDKNTGADEHVRAKVVVLAASAMRVGAAAAQLEVDVASRNGLANSSGIVGQVSHRHDRRRRVRATSRRSMDHIPHNHDGVGGMHVYMPWWLDNKKLDFPRGYHIEVYGGAGQPSSGFVGGIQRYNGGGYGKQLKDDYRKYYGATIGFDGRGEMIPNEDSYCELDPTIVDQFGIPVLRFHWKFTDHEYNQAKHMQETFRSLIVAMGGTPNRPDADEGAAATASPTAARSSTSSAACAWAAIRKTSVVNANCQAHDVKNLFVADGSPFVSQADKNPTWTILALVVAHERLHRAAAQGGGAMSDDDSDDEQPASGERRHRRRRALQILGAVPVAGGARCAAADAAAATEAARRRRHVADPDAPPRRHVGAPRAPQFFNAHEWTTARHARRLHHSARRALRQRDRREGPRVHGLPARREGRERQRRRSRCAAASRGSTPSAASASARRSSTRATRSAAQSSTTSRIRRRRSRR